MAEMGKGAGITRRQIASALGSPVHSLGFANLLYDPGTRHITGLLDYEDCIGGDPLFELAWMCYYYGDRCSDQPFFDYDRFCLGYGAWPEESDRAMLYRPFTYLDKLTWIDVGAERAIRYRHILSDLVARW